MEKTSIPPSLSLSLVSTRCLVKYSSCSIAIDGRICVGRIAFKAQRQQQQRRRESLCCTFELLTNKTLQSHLIPYRKRKRRRKHCSNPFDPQKFLFSRFFSFFFVGTEIERKGGNETRTTNKTKKKRNGGFDRVFLFTASSKMEAEMEANSVFELDARAYSSGSSRSILRVSDEARCWSSFRLLLRPPQRNGEKQTEFKPDSSLPPKSIPIASALNSAGPPRPRRTTMEN